MDYNKNFDLADINYFCEFDNIWKIEQWKDVLSTEKMYQVSDLGRVKSFKCNKQKILKPHLDIYGYYLLRFNKKNNKIHQLVAIAFLGHTPCGYKLVVNHKDFDRTNNHVDNLEIVTQRENANKKHIKSSSKYVGVSYRKPYVSQIRIDGKLVNLGCYNTEIEAHNAYQEALKKLT